MLFAQELTLLVKMSISPSLARFLSLLFCSGLLLVAASSEDEMQSLFEFKKGIQQDPLGKVLNTWIPSAIDPNSCPQSFYGVSCDDNGNVSAIELNGLGLVGDLKFSTLIKLKMLTTLSLSGNSFSGRLVPALGSMTYLQRLDLSGNQFYGPIPDRINGLRGLNYLNLSSNNFTGGFPNQIRDLQQLKVLDLHSNQLWGDIQGLFSEIGNVEHVDLSNNMFFGSLSMNWGNISSWPNTLQYLNLSHNRLGGELFGNVSVPMFWNLQVLDLGYTQLTGLFQSFRSLPKLRILGLRGNQLFGPIPEELLENLIPLEELDLSGNGFSGSLSLINSTTLRVLNLSSNSLSGPLPSSMGRSVVVLDLSYNMFTGDISVMKTWESSLDILDLSSNMLSGTIPSASSSFQTFTTLIIRNNSLVGNLPRILWTSPKLSTLDLSLNKLGGPIPLGLLTSTTMTNLNLSGNHFTGTIPFQGSHASDLLSLPSYPPLEFLDLSDNSLTGILLSDVGDLGRLKLLNLAMNNLSGQIPDELSKLVKLDYLDLSVNNFSGAIPNNLSSSLRFLNVSYNALSGSIPKNLKNFSVSSFRPGNNQLIGLDNTPNQKENNSPNKPHKSSNIRIAIIIATVGATLMIVFVVLGYNRSQVKDFHVRSRFVGQSTINNTILESFSHNNLLTSKSRSLPSDPSPEGVTTTSSATAIPNFIESRSVVPGRKSSSGSSPVSSSPRFIEQSVRLDVASPDRLVGELFFLDTSLAFTAEELSRAPAEVLGRSSHGTLYKASLDSGNVLSVKWLRVGLVKQKKEFAKEVKKLGSVRHPNIVPLRAYYWGPREQERLILADYIHGDNLALHLYETTPRRYSALSLNQRLKVAIDVAQSLSYLHVRGLPHGNLKPTNIIIIMEGSNNFHVRLTDYGLHKLMTPAGISEQILNLGALGYRAPELASVATLKGDVYSFGVILMELLTRKSAGDIISGQSGAVDLTDWVRLCNQEGRGIDCIDRDISATSGGGGGDVVDEMLAISLRCILPVNQRPNMKQVFEDLSSITP